MITLSRDGRRVRLDTTVTGVGEMAGEFFEAAIMVLFGEDAPEELLEVAVVHAPNAEVGCIHIDDVITVFGESEHRMTVLAVGDVVNENLANLGHLVMKCNGETTAPLPGDLCCTAGPLPAIAVGDRIVIEQGPSDE